MASTPRPRRKLSSELTSTREKARRQFNSSPFFGTGMHPNGQQGLDSDNYVPGTSGFSLNGGTGVAEFKDIILYDLPNSMLASPVSPVTLHADASNFGPTTSGVNIMTVSATVPAGYTKALLIGLYVSAFAQNTTASTDFLYANVLTTPATAGWQIPSASCPAGNWASAFQQGTLLISGLSGGGTVTVRGQVSTASGGWTAQSSNVANLDVAVLWLR